MCFSATASFTASAVLGGVGAASLALPIKKEEKMLALIPILFAIQQFCEGIVWLSFSDPIVNLLASKIFLFAAFSLWPFLIPYAFWRREPSKEHRERMKWFVWLGWVVAIYGLVVVFLLPTQTQIYCSSIRYFVVGYPPILGLGYLLATIGASISSSSRWIRVFGIGLFFAILLSDLFWWFTAYSTWCFFGAWLSILLFFHLREHVRHRISVLGFFLV